MDVIDIVRTKVNYDFIFTEYNNESLKNINEFIKNVLTSHSVKPGEYDIKLLDQYGTPIQNDHIPLLITKFKHCSSFFIELQLNPIKEKVETPDQIRQKLESYLSESEAGLRALEESKENQFLSIPTRKKLMSAVCDFIQELFGNETNCPKVRAVCRELIELFPSLKIEPSKIGGIDLIYNTAKNTGFIYNLLKNRSKCKHVPKGNEAELGDDEKIVEATQNISLNDKEFTEEEKNEILIYFKSCVVHLERSSLVEKLKETVKLRDEILNSADVNISKSFPFYFVAPDLILEDYGIRHPELSSNALHETWPFVSEKISSWREQKHKRDYDLIDTNINLVITLLKRLQPIRVTLSLALKSFLVFFQDPLTDPVNAIQTMNCHPCIIIIGSNTKNVRYYIHVKNQLIPVPEGSDFLKTLDMFFKSFKVFHLEYHPHLVWLMTFFGKFIFKTVETGILFSRLLEVNNLIFGNQKANQK